MFGLNSYCHFRTCPEGYWNPALRIKQNFLNPSIKPSLSEVRRRLCLYLKINASKQIDPRDTSFNDIRVTTYTSEIAHRTQPECDDELVREECFPQDESQPIPMKIPTQPYEIETFLGQKL